LVITQILTSPISIDMELATLRRFVAHAGY